MAKIIITAEDWHVVDFLIDLVNKLDNSDEWPDTYETIKGIATIDKE